jgi:hypothetical protein
MNQVKGYNEMSFKEAQKKRHKLLTLVPDQFTPVQASEAWGLPIANVNAMTQKMRRYNLIVPNEGKKGRIFTKIKEECHGN